MVTKKVRNIFFLLSPAVIVLLLVAGWPLGKTIFFSFTDADLLNMEVYEWVGLHNYWLIATDSYWWKSVANTVIFTVASISIETVLGVGIALSLSSNIRMKGPLRAAVLIPWAIPTVVSAKMWAWMFNDSYGVVNEFLMKSGLVDHRISWLGDDNMALLTMVIVDVWKTTPFVALLVLAGLQSIPRHLYEAAQLAGSSTWTTFWHITLPLLKPALYVAILFRMLDALRIFDLPYVLTSNSRSTATMSVYARQQLVNFADIGIGSASAVMIFVIIALMAALFVGLTKKHLGLRL